MSISTNIVAVTFGSSRRACGDRILHQRDRGQVLTFPDLAPQLPPTFQVWFANFPDSGSAVPQTGAAGSVPIPDTLVSTGRPIWAWLYLHTGENDGETCFTATILNTAQPAFTGATPTPSEASAWDEAIAELNDAIEAAEAAASHGPQILGGYWYTWNAETEEYENTGIKAGGSDGYSPEVTITPITGGHRVTITDEAHPNGQSFDVMDGQDLSSIVMNPKNGISTVPITGSWIRGEIKSTGVNGSSTTRILLNTYDMELSAGAIIECSDDDYLVQIAEYSGTAANTFLRLSDWGAKQIVQYSSHVRFVMRYADSRTIVDQDLTDLPAALTVYPGPNVLVRLSEAQNNIDDLEYNEKTLGDGFEFSLLGIDLVHRQLANDGSVGSVVRDYLATTPDFFTLPFNTVLMTDAPYIVTATKFDSDGVKVYTGSSGVDRVFIEAGRKYRFQFAYGSSSGVLDMDDLRKHVRNYSRSRMETPVSYNFDKYFPGVISANHRGYNSIAPENTIPAYQLSKSKGFAFGETDINWTSDGVAVLLHDATINNVARNPDGTQISGDVAIQDITYAQALEYDFGIKMGEEFAGTKIATFDEFIELCHDLDYGAVLQIAPTNATKAQCQALVEKVQSLEMGRSVLWLCASISQARWLIDADPCACVGLYGYSITELAADNLAACLTGYNRLWYDFAYNKGAGTLNWDSQTAHDLCTARDIMVGVYDANLDASILALKPSVKIITSDTAVPARVLYMNGVGSYNGATVFPMPTAEDVGAYVKPSGGIPASDLASGIAVPLGGTVGQVLKKTADGPAWANESGGGGSSVEPYTSDPAALGTASPGSSDKYARGDHVHPKPSASDIGAAEVLWCTYGTTTSAEVEAAYQAGKIVLVGNNFNVFRLTARISATYHVFTVATSAGTDTVVLNNDAWSTSSKNIPSASNSTPQALGTAVAGSSSDFSRADHVHPKPSASDIGAVAVAQGVAHAGEFVVVGSDGNITTVTMSVWQGGSY